MRIDLQLSASRDFSERRSLKEAWSHAPLDRLGQVRSIYLAGQPCSGALLQGSSEVSPVSPVRAVMCLQIIE